jgi:hypothetical protein
MKPERYVTLSESNKYILQAQVSAANEIFIALQEWGRKINETGRLVKVY